MTDDEKKQRNIQIGQAALNSPEFKAAVEKATKAAQELQQRLDEMRDRYTAAGYGDVIAETETQLDNLPADLLDYFDFGEEIELTAEYIAQYEPAPHAPIGEPERQQIAELIRQHIEKAKAGTLYDEPEIPGQMTIAEMMISENARYPRRPENHLLNQARLVKKLATLPYNQVLDVNISTPKKRGMQADTYATCTLTIDETGVTYENKIEYLDKMIMDAIGTIWACRRDALNIPYFTASTIYAVMNGQPPDDDSAPPKARAEIEKAIDKLSSTKMHIKQNNIAEPFKGTLLHVDYGPVSYRGQMQTAYILRAEPLLFWYARNNNPGKAAQIATIPARLLDTKSGKGGRNNTLEFACIRHYVISRIIEMKSSKKLSHKIRYDTLFDEIGIKSTSRDKRSQVYAAVDVILEHLIKQKEIKRYSRCIEGRAVVGVIVTF